MPGFHSAGVPDFPGCRCAGGFPVLPPYAGSADTLCRYIPAQGAGYPSAIHQLMRRVR